MSTFFAEAASIMEASYHEAVGWCLQYGIKTYRSPGGDAKTLGELRAAIREHEVLFGPAQPDVMSVVMAEIRRKLVRREDERLWEIFRQMEASALEAERLNGLLAMGISPRRPWWKRLLRLA